MSVSVLPILSRRIRRQEACICTATSGELDSLCILFPKAALQLAGMEEAMLIFDESRRPEDIVNALEYVKIRTERPSSISKMKLDENERR